MTLPDGLYDQLLTEHLLASLTASLFREFSVLRGV